jgi:hypothetical protein
MNVVRYTPWLLPFLLFPVQQPGRRNTESRTTAKPGVEHGQPDARGTGGTAGTIIVPPGGAGGTVMTGPCTGLCNQTTCAGACTEMPCAAGTSTTISGVVYDPAGQVPIYNVIVYVPNAPVPAFTDGASCDVCGQGIVNPVTSTLTDTHGHFSLPDAPVGSAVPLVIQIGKWRRQITVPNVPRCVDTALTDVEQTSLPSNKTEGDIPPIAITTGGAGRWDVSRRRVSRTASSRPRHRPFTSTAATIPATA